MKITSPEFHHGQPIPKRYASDGEDISPPLNWSGAPEGTHAFALVCEDLDATDENHPFIHWIVYGISSRSSVLPEGLAPVAEIGAPISAYQGRNSFGNLGYGGPQPPSGTHRYVFTLYALDADIGLKPGLGYTEVMSAMRGHILEQAGIKGTYRPEAPFKATLGDALRARVGAAATTQPSS